MHKGAGGRDKRYTYPDEAPELNGTGYDRNQWRVEEDGALVGTAGHLHPGGLWTDLKLTRDGRTVPLFRSRAKYFEPAGAVSWDVAMTATPEDWRVAVRRGDVLSVSATYDTRRSSWYESMGIMPVAFDAGGGGRRPVRHERQRAGESPTGTCARTATTAARSAACPTRASCSRPRRRRRAPCRSAASSTATATSA